MEFLFNSWTFRPYAYPAESSLYFVRTYGEFLSFMRDGSEVNEEMEEGGEGTIQSSENKTIGKKAESEQRGGAFDLAELEICLFF